MTPRDEQIQAHEGFAQYVYCDDCGKPWRECMEVRERWLTMGASGSVPCMGGNMTTGWGANLEHGIPMEVHQMMFRINTAKAEDAVNLTFPTGRWDMHDPQMLVRWDTLVELAFMLGSFGAFPKFRAAIHAQDWDAAYSELLFSNRNCPECDNAGGNLTRDCSHCLGSGRDRTDLWKQVKGRAETLARQIRYGVREIDEGDRR